jgi:hypothetical protein
MARAPRLVMPFGDAVKKSFTGFADCRDDLDEKSGWSH